MASSDIIVTKISC